LAARGERLGGKLDKVLRWRNFAVGSGCVAMVAQNTVLNDGPMLNDFSATSM
jgi:hypothetical protein